MNRADQIKLVQKTNLDVVAIRNFEIKYYVTLYETFGTQAALIVGFTYCTFSQNEVKYSKYDIHTFTFIYFAFAALTMAIGVHVILSTVLLTVFGSGLAIIGPLGSMARSAKGLQMEQEQVIISFIAMILSFALSTVFVFWMIMDYPPAFICSSMFIVAAYMWYTTCERMYLRFYWNKEDDGWQQRDRDDDDIDEEDDEPRLPYMGSNIADTEDSSVIVASKDSKNTSFLTTLKERVGIRTHNTTGSTSPPSQTGVAGKKSVTTEGYLGIKRASVLTDLVLDREKNKKSNTSNNNSGTKWKRQYFVLFSNGCLYTYRTRQEYRNDPSSPKYTRPIKVSEYAVGVQNLDLASRLECSDDALQADTQSVESSHTSSTIFSSASTSSAMINSRFQITLTPFGNSCSSSSNISSSSSLQDDGILRTLWLLRSDTEEEQDIWVEGLRAVSPNSFSSNNLY